MAVLDDIAPGQPDLFAVAPLHPLDAMRVGFILEAAGFDLPWQFRWPQVGQAGYYSAERIRKMRWLPPSR
jgi:hypothetical protein